MAAAAAATPAAAAEDDARADGLRRVRSGDCVAARAELLPIRSRLLLRGLTAREDRAQEPVLGAHASSTQEPGEHQPHGQLAL